MATPGSAPAAGYSLRLTVPGGVEVGAAGITAIGVMPSHRRRGILRQMMRWLVDQAGERGEPVAILWASETAIYQRFGFGIGTLQGTFDIERSRTQFAHPVEPLGRMRLVDRDEALELIPPVYDAVRPRIPGAVSRRDVKWRHQLLDDAEWTRRGNGRKFIAVLEVDGEVRGYAIYRVKTEWDERGPNNTLTTIEVLGLDAAAERTIWEWLFGIDLVAHIKGWRTRVPQPLLLQLAEPRRLGLAVREGMLLRILDLPAALEGRGYDTAGTITFEVTDELRPSNAGRWRLTVTGGSAAGDAFRGLGHGHRGRARPDPRHDGPRVGLSRRVQVRRPGPCRSGEGVPAGGDRGRGPDLRVGHGAVVLDDVLSRGQAAG